MHGLSKNILFGSLVASKLADDGLVAQDIGPGGCRKFRATSIIACEFTSLNSVTMSLKQRLARIQRKEEDFQIFMALLDGDRFEGRYRDGVHTADPSDLMRRMVKEEILRC